MIIESMVASARARGASDLHIEPRLRPVVRVDGRLEAMGAAIDPSGCTEIARELLNVPEWDQFVTQQSFDLSRTIAGIRCRVNVLQSIRGVGLAVRLLGSVEPTLESLNLHPDLRQLVDNPHGLVLVCGATGSGKSSTLAALIHELNLTEACHIVTLEEPVEYVFAPRAAFIRQRQVGVNTPSFEQGLVDVLREDPDVVMIGEMRHPEVMRLTLNVAETGHLTFATIHSSSAVEALQRMVSSFPAEIQAGVSAQLADCLLAVVCQRLVYYPEVGLRIPELEVLIGSPAVKNLVRQGQFFKIASLLATGAKEGMWTFERYRQWMSSRSRWNHPEDFVTGAASADELVEARLSAADRGSLPAESGVTPPPAPANPAAEGKPVFTIGPEDQDLSQLISQLRPRP